jgi:hypothetical protein
VLVTAPQKIAQGQCLTQIRVLDADAVHSNFAKDEQVLLNKFGVVIRWVKPVAPVVTWLFASNIARPVVNAESEPTLFLWDGG